jgi:hypothetical protein
VKRPSGSIVVPTKPIKNKRPRNSTSRPVCFVCWHMVMMETYKIIRVPERARTDSRMESLGTKFKFWFENDLRTKLLYKEGRADSGEDWSEKVAAELCGLLEIPHAEYDFGTWRDASGNERKGVVSPSFLPDDGVFFPGLTFLNTSREQRLEDVLNLFHSTIYLSTFVGYLMLDSWIGNTDRHSENWGLLFRVDDKNRNGKKFRGDLAPTFDHASSLGVRLTDDNRKARLTTRDAGHSIAAYAARCRTPFSAVIDG